MYVVLMDNIKRWKKFATTAEILDEIEKIQNGVELPEEIVLLPPIRQDNETDDDSEDEKCTDSDGIGYRLLQTPAEVRFRDVCTVDDLNVMEKSAKIMKKTKKWELTKDPPMIQTDNIIRSLPMVELDCDSHPIEFFHLYFDDDMIEYFLSETEKYSKLKNHEIFVQKDEIYVFFGILLMSGHVPLPKRMMYWEDMDDARNVLVSRSMDWNRFEEIFRYFHIADNDSPPSGDHLAKVRPLIEKLNFKFMTYAPVENKITIDETLIPYFGRRKDQIRGKPIKFGYKVYMMCLSNGYCLRFDLYQGPKPGTEGRFRLGESVVLNFAQTLKNNFGDVKFSLFFGGFFTTKRLISSLGRMGLTGTGIVHDNITEHYQLEDHIKISKRPQGYYTSSYNKSDNIATIRWKNKKIITVMSNEYGPKPVQQISTYSTKNMRGIQIDQPFSISQYYKHTAGVNLLKNNISNYRINIRGKKWYCPIWLWMLDVCVINSWILSRQFGSKIDYLDFRRHLVTFLLTSYGKTKIIIEPDSSPISGQSTNKQHLIVSGGNWKSCCMCERKTVTLCDICIVPLHYECFVCFHKENFNTNDE